MFSPDEGKDIWANAKEKPSLEQAIELFKVKLHPELAPEKPESKSSVIKVIDKYQIKSGPYGPYIQTGSGPKNIKFHKITGGIKPEDITLEDCKKICGSLKTTKKTTKKYEVKDEEDNKSTVSEKKTKKTTKKVSSSNEV
jgi:topoisomerase IA-like protein